MRDWVAVCASGTLVVAHLIKALVIELIVGDIGFSVIVAVSHASHMATIGQRSHLVLSGVAVDYARPVRSIGRCFNEVIGERAGLHTLKSNIVSDHISTIIDTSTIFEVVAAIRITNANPINHHFMKLSARTNTVSTRGPSTTIAR